MSVNVAGIPGDGSYLLRHLREEWSRLAGAESGGIWLGLGAGPLGLAGRKVAPQVFLRLLQGYSPDGAARLTRNAGSPRRTPGWEMLVGAHKSVSDLLAVLPERERGLLLRCVYDTLRKDVLPYLEAYCGLSRRGKGGAVSERAGLVIAVFLHLVNRLNEPHIHLHVEIVNLGYRASDRTYGALVSRRFYERQRLLKSLFHLGLANRLSRCLGLVCQREGYAAAVRGVPVSFVQATSTRSAQIARELNERGHHSPRAAAYAAWNTRPPKQLLPFDELLRGWRELARQHGFSLSCLPRRWPRHVPYLSGKLQELRARKALLQAAKSLASQNAIFDRWELHTHTATACIGRGVPVACVAQAVSRAVTRPRKFGLVEVGREHGEPLFTTRAHWRLEQKLLRHVDALAGHRQAVRPRAVEKVLSHATHLNEEQCLTVRRLTGPGLGLLAGPAGAARTATLRAAAEAYRRAGWAVLGCAVTGRAASALQQETGIPSLTLAKLLQDLRPLPHREVFRQLSGRSFRSLWSRLQAAEELRRPRLRLSAKTVILLDEAGLAGTANLKELVACVRRHGARLILAGDPKQQPSRPAGGVFAFLLARYAHQAAHVLETVRREELRRRGTVEAKGAGVRREARRTDPTRGRESGRRCRMAAAVHARSQAEQRHYEHGRDR